MRHRVLGGALLLVLAISGGFACGEAQETSDPAVTLQQEADRLKARSEALRSDGPEYTGPVQVVGSDPYDLDSDGDGYACE
jgi:hypothetical protein